MPEFANGSALTSYIAAAGPGSQLDVLRFIRSNQSVGGGLANLDEVQRRMALAAVAGRGRTSRDFDLGAARAALVRLARGDASLPANALGQRVSWEQPVWGSAPQRYETVTGQVVSVSPEVGAHVTVVIEREDRGEHDFPRASLRARAGAQLTVLEPAAAESRILLSRSDGAERQLAASSADPIELLPGMTPVRRAQLVQAMEDFAAQYGGPDSPTPGAGNAARYIVEGHVPDASHEEWDWIAGYLQAHPELLTREPYTSVQLAERRAARSAHANALSTEAHTAYLNQDYDRAGELITRAATIDPSRAERWASIQARIDEARPQPAAPVTPASSPDHSPAGPGQPAASNEFTDRELGDLIAERSHLREQPRSQGDSTMARRAALTNEILRRQGAPARDQADPEAERAPGAERLSANQLAADAYLAGQAGDTEAALAAVAHAEAADPEQAQRWRTLRRQYRGLPAVPSGTSLDENGDVVETLAMPVPPRQDILIGPGQIPHAADLADRLQRVGGSGRVDPARRQAINVIANWLRTGAREGEVPEPFVPADLERDVVAAEIDGFAAELAAREEGAWLRKRPGVLLIDDLREMASKLQQGEQAQARAAFADALSRARNAYFDRARRADLVGALRDMGSADPAADADHIYRGDPTRLYQQDTSTDRLLNVTDRLDPDTSAGRVPESPYSSSPQVEPRPTSALTAEPAPELAPEPSAGAVEAFPLPLDGPMRALLTENPPRGTTVNADLRGVQVTDPAAFGAQLDELRDRYQAASRLGNRSDNLRMRRAAMRLQEALDQHMVESRAAQPPVAPAVDPLRPQPGMIDYSRIQRQGGTEQRDDNLRRLTAAELDAVERQARRRGTIGDSVQIERVRRRNTPANLRAKAERRETPRNGFEPRAPDLREARQLRERADDYERRDAAGIGRHDFDTLPFGAAPELGPTSEPAPAAPTVNLPEGLRSRGLTTAHITGRDGWQSVERADGTVVAIRDAAGNYLTDTDPDAPRIPPARLTAYLDALTGPRPPVLLTGTDRRRILARLSPTAAPEAETKVDAMSDSVVRARAREEKRRAAAGEPPVSAETRDLVIARAEMLPAPPVDRELELVAQALSRQQAAGPRAPKTRAEHPIMEQLRQEIADKVAAARQHAGQPPTPAAEKGLPPGSEFHFTPAQRVHDDHTLELHSRGTQIGTLTWKAHDGDISGVGTHHDYLRRGVATALYTKAHELSREHGITAPGESVFQTHSGKAFRTKFDSLDERPDVSGIPTHHHRGPGEDDTNLHEHLIKHHYSSSPDLVRSWSLEQAQEIHDNVTQSTPCGWRSEAAIPAQPGQGPGVTPELEAPAEPDARTAVQDAGLHAPVAPNAAPDARTTDEALSRAGRFRPASQAELAPSGSVSRVRANIAALQTLRTIQREQRRATAAEQAVLARWSGWGAVPEAFDPDRAEFARARDQLAELLDPAERAAAERNTLNAHYTDLGLVAPIWSALQELGFTGGRVLEPGCGSGNFIGSAPPDAQVVGVELEPVTAAIAAELYPDAQILAESFADTRASEGGFDLVVGNVPFAKATLNDRQYNRGRHSIHNHFIIKSLHLTAPGGLVAVITSRYTLDAANPAARREMAQLADLVGAIRLPQAAHQRAAGTQVVTDLLVFRRREHDYEPQPVDWELTELADIGGQQARVNSYFLEHPEMVCGELSVGRGQFSDAELTVLADRPAPELLTEKLGILVERARAAELTHSPTAERPPAMRAALLGRRSDLANGHLLVVGDGFAQVCDGVAEPYEVPATQHAELRALLELRDTVVALLEAEATSLVPTLGIDELRDQLNAQYDRYVDRYKPLNRFAWRKTGRVHPETGEPIMARIPAKQGGFRSDPASPLVYALESFDSSTQRATKADIFTQRVVAPRTPRLGADSPADALAICMDVRGRVDLDEIARLLGLTAPEAREALGQLVFEDPAKDGGLVPAAEYLSGNVRVKRDAARAAAAEDPRFEPNVAALAEVVPPDLAPEDIVARLGAPWIDERYVEQFLREVLEDPTLTVEHAYGSHWTVKGNEFGVTATSTWGTPDCPAPKLAETLLEQQSPMVHDVIEYSLPGGGTSTRRVLNVPKTAEAVAKGEELGARFSDWVWEDPQRATELARTYNDRFNSLVLRNYDDVELSLPGLALTFKPRPHQVAAVARMCYSADGVGLYHEVGAGKTAEMAMGVMELRRLGLVRKGAIVVPNHMLEQVTREFQQLYPQAKLLAASSADLTKDKRRAFVARVTTGDWDAVILTRGAFARMQLSPKEQADYLADQTRELKAAIERQKASGQRSYSLKRMQTRLLNAEEKIKDKLNRPHDPAVTFEQSGIDYVVIDEAQDYKNLRTASNIPGAEIEGSGRASDLEMKLHYLRRRHGERVVTFATATPILNSVTEAHVMMRYLTPALLEAAGVLDFDSWAAAFGRTVTEVELAPAGTSFRLKSRFAGFHNVPELLRAWWGSGDVQTADDLNLPRPKLLRRPEDGQRQPETVIVPPTADQLEYIHELGERAERVSGVDKKIDNMLLITSQGRAVAVDPRLVGLPAPPSGESKIEAVADKIAEVWARHQHDRFTDPSGAEHPVPGALQLVFCDLGTPKDGQWSVYEELRTQIAAHGVPADKVRFIHEARNDKEKAELFQACRTGGVSVLIGSTAKMGTGTNVQDRVAWLHHVDCPYRPGDLTQRDGRGVRQGNQYPEIGITRYVTEASFDAYLWQGIARKAEFIAQLMRGRLDVREIEDIGDAALSANEVKALAAGNPLLLDKAKADAELTKLERLERAHIQARTRLRHSIGQNERTIELCKGEITAIEAAIAQRRDTRGENFRMIVDGRAYDERPDAGQALRDRLALVLDRPGPSPSTIHGVAELGGLTFDATIWRTKLRTGYDLTIAGIQHGPVGGSQTQLLESKPSSLPIRMENRLDGLDKNLRDARNAMQTCRDEIVRAQRQIEQPFAHGEALDAAKRRAADLDKQLDELAAPPTEAATVADPPTDGPAADTEERRHPPVPHTAPPAGRPRHPALAAAATMQPSPDGPGSAADRSATSPQRPATRPIPPPRLDRGSSATHQPPASRR